MSTTVSVTVISSSEPVVLTPDVAAALQAALAYLTANKQTAADVQTAVTAADNAAISAQAAEDQARALLTAANLQSVIVTIFSGLPTTKPAATGELWNDAGHLALS